MLSFVLLFFESIVLAYLANIGSSNTLANIGSSKILECYACACDMISVVHVMNE